MLNKNIVRSVPLFIAAALFLFAGGGLRPANAASTFTVNTTDNAGGTCTGDPAPCSLRTAMTLANAQPGSTINFGLVATTGPAPVVFTIKPVTPLPIITDPVTIDGYTQTGASKNMLGDSDDAVIVIEIDGSSLVSGGDGFNIAPSAKGAVITGLAINNFTIDPNVFPSGYGIHVRGDGNTIVGNFVGTDTTGEIAKPNERAGIRITGDDNTIGGMTFGDRNIISGNTDHGVQTASTFDQVQSFPDGNKVQQNFIGVDATGAVALPNGNAGIHVGASTNTLVGGPDGRNIISGNLEHGVRIQSSTCPNQVCMEQHNTVQSNFIGTDATGKLAVPNQSEGVSIVNGATFNLVGGTDATFRNIIAGNADDNISIEDTSSHDNNIQGNYIGLDVTGAAVLGGGGAGIFIGGSPNNYVGGASLGHANYISGHTENGMLISRLGSLGNLVKGNFIGVDVTGGPAGNGLAGIRFHNGSDGNLVGGEAEAEWNEIAHNGGPGVLHTMGDNGPDPQHNSILGNRIHDNGGLGVDINLTPPATGEDDAPDGVTENDANDADEGPNDAINFPVITAASLQGGTLTVDGTIDVDDQSTPTVLLYVSSSCDPSGNGEGEVYAGSLSVPTDNAGDATFHAVLSNVPSLAVVTATTKGEAGSTSEFSDCFAIGTVQGNADCVGGVTLLDALAIFKAAAGIGTVPCPDAANVNCTGGVDEADGLLIVAYVADVYEVPTGCTPIGALLAS